MMNAVKLTLHQHGCMQEDCKSRNVKDKMTAVPEQRLKIMLGNLIGFFIKQYEDRCNTRDELVQSLCDKMGTDEAELKDFGIDLSKESWEEDLAQNAGIPEPYSMHRLECLLVDVVSYEVSKCESGEGTEQAERDLQDMGFSAEEMVLFGFPETVQ